MKVIGVGLNKTGTKTLAHYCESWGFRHRTFDLGAFQMYRRGEIHALLDSMQDYDSFEDWPWPLIWREIDERYPEARFVLTVRESPEIWYRSLCKMAVRMGPLRDFEQHIYGYAMPQGHRDEHLAFYRDHNQAVEDHFRDRPGKLLKVCFGESDATEKLAEFLGQEPIEGAPYHENANRSRVYAGSNLWIAQAVRVIYQPYAKARIALSQRAR